MLILVVVYRKQKKSQHCNLSRPFFRIAERSSTLRRLSGLSLFLHSWTPIRTVSHRPHSKASAICWVDSIRSALVRHIAAIRINTRSAEHSTMSTLCTLCRVYVCVLTAAAVDEVHLAVVYQTTLSTIYLTDRQ